MIVVGESPSDAKAKDLVIKANIAKLSEIRDGLEPEVSAELELIMEKVKALAIELCPKDTGSLASSISLESGTRQEGDFYGASIYAGSDDIVNPHSGKPTSSYVSLVHDGHANRDGSFYEGVPFLTDALDAYAAELENAVSRALKTLGEGD